MSESLLGQDNLYYKYKKRKLFVSVALEEKKKREYIESIQKAKLSLLVSNVDFK